MKINGRHESKCVFTSVLNRVGLVGPKYFDVGLVGSCLRGSRGSKLFLRGSEINLRGSEIILRGSEIYLRGSNFFTWVREKLVGQNFP